MDFLQSKIWREFQASVGRKTFYIENFASIIEHQLPIVGKYFYIPRGPEIHETYNIKHITSELIKLAKDNNIGWIRIEPESESALNTIKNSLGHSVSKSPHDVQPKELFVIDISKSEEEIIAQMKQKTRYNLRLAEKKNIKIIVSREEKYINEFLRLVKITSERDGIVPHPENYYRKMIEMISAENLQLYLAEYEGKIIVANIMIFFEDMAIYLHGASDNEFRNVMAPYLLQWKQIQDAKAKGCKKYDFGGVRTQGGKGWEGITRFKVGFSPSTKSLDFPGSYDIIISPVRYWIYRAIQKAKSIL